MTSITDPVCPGCEGYGHKLLNQVLHQRSDTPCDECGGSGRIAAKIDDPQQKLPGDDDVTLDQPA